jgi:hypothetical protein
MDAASKEASVVHLPGLGLVGRRQAPYAGEVLEAMRGGVQPNTYIFAGGNCWDRAIKRRIQFGLGCALVLPDGCAPEDLIWPPLDAVIVAWPNHSFSARELKLRLTQALIRDGVRYAAMEHAPEWILARPAGAQPHD